MKNLKNMLGSAVERKPKVEQVNVTGGRLLREAKVCFVIKKNSLSGKNKLFWAQGLIIDNFEVMVVILDELWIGGYP